MAVANPTVMADIGAITLSDAAAKLAAERRAKFEARKKERVRAAKPSTPPQTPAAKTPPSVTSPLNGTFATAAKTTANDNNAAPRSSWAQILTTPLKWFNSLWARKGELVSHFKTAAHGALFAQGARIVTTYGLSASEMAGAGLTFGASSAAAAMTMGYYKTLQEHKKRIAADNGAPRPFLIDYDAFRKHGIRGLSSAFMKDNWKALGKNSVKSLPLAGSFMAMGEAAFDFRDGYSKARASDPTISRWQFFRNHWGKYTTKATLGLGAAAAGYWGLNNAMDHIEQANAAAAITREEIARVTNLETIKPATINAPVNAAPATPALIKTVSLPAEEIPAPKAAESIISPVSYVAKPDATPPARPWIGRWPNPNLKTEGFELAAYRPPRAPEFAIGNAPPQAEGVLTVHDSPAAKPTPPTRLTAPPAPVVAPAAPAAPAAPEAPAAEIPPAFKTETPAPATPPAFGPDIFASKALENAVPAPQAETAAPAAPETPAASESPAAPETPDTTATTVDYTTLPLEERINVLLQGIDRSGLSEKALHELKLADKLAAQGNVPWTVGNVGYYFANGKEGFPKDYASAWEWGLVADEVAKKSGSEINIRLADKFLRELQGLWNDAPKEFVSAYNPEAPAPATPSVTPGASPLPAPATPKPEISTPPAAAIPRATITPAPLAPPSPATIPPPFITDAPASGGTAAPAAPAPTPEAIPPAHPVPAAPAESAPPIAPPVKPVPDLPLETPTKPEAPVVKIIPPSEAAAADSPARQAPAASQAETPAAPKAPETPAAVDISTLPLGERMTRLMEGIDRSDLTKKALADLKAAETLAADGKAPWAAGNVGYYFANGKEGFPKDYARAWECFIMMKEVAVKAGSQLNIETADKRLRELQNLWPDAPKQLSSAYGPEVQVATAPVPEAQPVVVAEAKPVVPPRPTTRPFEPVSRAPATPLSPPKQAIIPPAAAPAAPPQAAANDVAPAPAPKAAPVTQDLRTASIPPVTGITPLPPPEGASAAVDHTATVTEPPSHKITVQYGGYELVLDKDATQKDMEKAIAMLRKADPDAVAAFELASRPPAAVVPAMAATPPPANDGQLSERDYWGKAMSDPSHG